MSKDINCRTRFVVLRHTNTHADRDGRGGGIICGPSEGDGPQPGNDLGQARDALIDDADHVTSTVGETWKRETSIQHTRTIRRDYVRAHSCRFHTPRPTRADTCVPM